MIKCIDFLKVSELTVKTWRSPNMPPPRYRRLGGETGLTGLVVGSFCC